MMDRFNVWVGSLYTRSHDIKKDEGQTFVEYALILTLVAVAAAALAAWAGVVGGISSAMGDVTKALGG